MANARNNVAKLASFASVTEPSFGALGDGATDDTAAIQAAIDAAAGGRVLVPEGTFVCETLYLPDNTTLEGMGEKSVLRLKDGYTGNLIENAAGADPNYDITIRNLYLMGNKASIAEGSRSRAVYFRNGDRYTMDNVTVDSFEDHGVMIFRPVVDDELDYVGDNVFINVRAFRCGKGSSSVGGSGILVNGHLFGCVGDGNYRNGFKSGTAKYYGCVARNTVAGGGFEGGYGATSKITSEYFGCSAINNYGNGWRMQGEADYFTINQCIAYGNGSSGIDCFGNTTKATIVNSQFFNNGTRSTRGTSTSADGIAFLKANTGTVRGAYLSGVTCGDTRSTGKTQEYGLYVEGDYEVEIGPGCDFTGNATGAMHLTGGINNSGQATPGTSIVVRSPIRGVDNFASQTSLSLTGTTDATDLWTYTHNAGLAHIGSVWRLRFFGLTEGTAGTKQIRVILDSTSQLLVNQSAGSPGAFENELILIKETATVWRVSYVTASGVVGAVTTNISSGDDRVISINGDLGNAGDTITIYSLTFEQVR